MPGRRVAAFRKPRRREGQRRASHLLETPAPLDTHVDVHTGLKSFFEWLAFKSLDFIWGNGESAARLCRFVLIIFFGMALYDVLNFGDAQRLGSYASAFLTASEIFVGVLTPDYYRKSYLALMTLIRLAAIGFFLSILIKRFNRR